MLRLKEVVDKQRDELRAQAHEIICKSRDTEAVSVWELQGVVCEGPGDLLSCHLPQGLSSQLVSLLAQMAFLLALYVLMLLGGCPELLLCLTLGCPGLSSCRSNCIASWP